MRSHSPLFPKDLQRDGRAVHPRLLIDRHGGHREFTHTWVTQVKDLGKILLRLVAHTQEMVSEAESIQRK